MAPRSWLVRPGMVGLAIRIGEVLAATRRDLILRPEHGCCIAADQGAEDEGPCCKTSGQPRGPTRHRRAVGPGFRLDALQLSVVADVSRYPPTL